MRIFLLLGSNLGSCVDQLTWGVEALSASAGEVQAQSFYYESEAWGARLQPNFINQAICLQSSLSVRALLALTQGIERRMGMRPMRKWGPRHLDIDILDYDAQCMREADLLLPHPYIAQRRFTLVPLAELAPDWLHPVLKKSAHELLRACSDPLRVWRYNP